MAEPPRPTRARWLEAHDDIAPFVVDLGEVSDAEKLWLLQHTRGVVYPSVYEGFGLVPFEARHTARRASSLEDLAAGNAPGRGGDDRALECDGNRRPDQRDPHRPAAAAALVERIRGAGASLTWDTTAAKVIDVYELAARSPDRTIVRLADDAGSPAALGARLAGEPLDALDLPDDVFRAMRALATHPRLRRPLFAVLRFTYVLGHLIRHGRPPEPIV